jgi:predicted methyltransferase
MTRLSCALLLSLASACSHGTNPPAQTTADPVAGPTPEEIVAAPDRTDDDRKLDAGRKPAELLRFIDLRPGMRVGELFAGGGYTTELLVRAVGPTGVVYAENTRMFLERFLEKPWSARLARPVNQKVVRVDRELDDPFPPQARDLDRVVSFVNYHDAVWVGTDRAKMNRAVFDALKPGGVFVICDSSAKEGSGTADAQKLHRIDEKVVRDEVPAAGFRLLRAGDFLRNPADTRDWSSSPREAGARRGTSDRFCLAYGKP